MTHSWLQRLIGPLFSGAGAAATLLAGAVALPLAAAEGQPRRTLVPMLFSQVPFDQSLTGRLLAAHNRERALFGAAPLQWDPNLAVAAASYGPMLSATGRLQHSTRANRPGQAENLWMGTRGAYPPEAMVGAWIDEKRSFRPGIFPNVSTSGNWQDVGHFTQLIWKRTTHVGCAVHRDARWDFLICRYSPKGNVDGRQVP